MSEESFYKAKEIYGETFYQLPKVLFTNPLYKGISNDAKVAYALLKDRFNYSIRNNWVDENDNIYFIFTNDELMSLLSSGNQKVIKIKKELDSVGLLLQKRMGVNKPNHLYLLRPEVEATDVYKQVNSSNVDKSGNVKITLPENVDKSGNVKITLPETANNTSSENVDKSGNVKITRNLYLQPLDTNIDTNIDTAKLDFSSKNFSQSEIKEQNQDLVSNAYKYLTGENVDNSMPFEPETIQLISYWVRTPEQMRSFIGIILNARKDIQADIEKQTGRPVTIIMDTEPELQKGITTTLRRYFNSMRNTDNKNKKINSPENYLYISMKNYFGYWYNSVMAKRNKEASN
ncbi:replication initiator protein A [Leuconostoc carnosum]|uniref:Uncharacterized protein n=1 Tax=Leuconostoc carnosum (strain JB16) TaxID=1229758 RepID=K0DCG0_LEUCJ|nr:replication initiator protein A [Leuconostoc carnosum]AFT82583.1 hypothetical protein C270_08541 [Leuconostoc carnosum JB16]EQC57779.1 plasmid replication initiation protein [Limosilactobacillus fermentum MTCC 8711]KAA8371333.1 replication initiator protein A [Leuconostoc carnosum]MBB6433473.1 hypothetical protein [Leuconostoc carnosum]